MHAHYHRHKSFFTRLLVRNDGIYLHITCSFVIILIANMLIQLPIAFGSLRKEGLNSL